MHKQDFTCDKNVKFTKHELLSIVEEEAKHICEKSDDVHSIAETALNDFIRRYGKFVQI